MIINLFKMLLAGAACYPFVAIAENAVTVNDNTLNPKVDETADSTRWQLDLNEIVVTGQGSAIQNVIQIFTKKGGKSGFNASVTAELGAEQATSDFISSVRPRISSTRPALHRNTVSLRMVAASVVAGA